MGLETAYLHFCLYLFYWEAFDSLSLFSSLVSHTSFLETCFIEPHVMSKKIKSQASSSRAAAAGFTGFGGFSTAFSGQGRSPSALTYVAEPPDLSRILEPQLVVAFKNSLKKDEITRTKALDDLRDHVSAVESHKGTLNDGFLEAWVG